VKLTERSVALQHLEADDLDGQLRSSLTELSMLGRRVSGEIRIRLLPMLKEVKRRYDAGETINKVEGFHAYLRSLGLTPSTVRSWARRNEHKILGDVLKSTGATKQINQQEKKYERELKDGIEDDIRFAEQQREEEREEKEFQRRLKEDPEFRRQHEEKERQDEQWQKSFFENVKRTREQAPKDEAQRLAHEDRIRKLMNEIIDDGFKQRSKKYHPDTGGTTEQFQDLAEAKAELQRLIEDSGRPLAKRFAA
jgi:hypothetical protein